MNYRSVADLNNTIIRGLHRIPGDVDLIVGIPRSGLLAANLLALHMNLPLTDLDGFVEGRLIRSGEGRRRPGSVEDPAFAKTALVLDDSVLSGATVRAARQRLTEAGMDSRVIYAAVYVAPESGSVVDLCFEEIVGARVFEWNVMHGGIIAKSCVDIDGVLCTDPTNQQNDDGPLYRRFLKEAQPLLLPSGPVGWLVTCRLEKYRELTEQWLKRHGVQYQELYMMDLPTKAARLAAGSHGSFKAQVYRSTNAMLFLESSERQATEIARLAGKPVLCMDTRQMAYPSLAAIGVREMPSLTRTWARKLRRGLRRHVLGFDPSPGVHA